MRADRLPNEERMIIDRERHLQRRYGTTPANFDGRPVEAEQQLAAIRAEFWAVTQEGAVLLRAIEGTR